MSDPAARIEHRQPVTDAALPPELHPVLARVYRNRGVVETGALDTGLTKLPPPERLKGSEQAAELIGSVIQAGETIVVVGDYDCDGATSTALALDFLPKLGAARVEFIVPNRFVDGYGLSPSIARQAKALGAGLIITVDNGISSHAGVAAAREHGIRTLITDHHLPGDVLPNADVIVNPNQPGCTFPSKHLAGVGVMFYVLMALRRLMRDRGAFESRKPPNLAAGLDLVALGTVADVVQLDHTNRILVEQGLRRMRAGHLRPGIRAMLDLAKRPLANLQASDLGFAVGPRLNAAGRLDDMAVGIRCLCSRDPAQARGLASQLHQLNAERRELEQEMRDHALSMVQSEDRVGLCLYDESWHEGVVGLVAGRVKDHFNRPTFAFAPAQEDGWLKGSGRSIPGLHIRDTLVTLASRHPGLLERFGGHAMAAGLSLPVAELKRFAQAFDALCRELIPATALERVYLVDGCLDDEHLAVDTARALESGGPWGQAFEEPSFEGVFQVAGMRVVGERHAKYSLRSPGGRRIEAIHFGGADVAKTSGQIQAVYRLVVNRFRDAENAELQLLAQWPA